MNWKNLLAEIMAKTKMNQIETAGALGISQSAVCYLMSGRTEDPKWTTGEKIVKYHASVFTKKPAVKKAAAKKVPTKKAVK